MDHTPEEDLIFSWLMRHVPILIPEDPKRTRHVDEILRALPEEENTLVRVIFMENRGLSEGLVSDILWPGNANRHYSECAQKSRKILQNLEDKGWIKRTKAGHYEDFKMDDWTLAPIVNRSTERKNLLPKLLDHMRVKRVFGEIAHDGMKNPHLPYGALFLYYLHTNDADSLATLLDHSTELPWESVLPNLFASEVTDPFNAEWFASRSVPMRILLLDTLLGFFFLKGGPFSSIDFLYRDLFSDRSGQTGLSPSWAGRLDALGRKLWVFLTPEAREGIPEPSETIPAWAESVAMKAISSLLEGKHEEAGIDFARAIKLRRKETGKRKTRFSRSIWDLYLFSALVDPNGDQKKTSVLYGGEFKGNQDSFLKPQVMRRLTEGRTSMPVEIHSRKLEDFIRSPLNAKGDLLLLYLGLLERVTAESANDGRDLPAVEALSEHIGKNGWRVWTVLLDELRRLLRMASGNEQKTDPLGILSLFRPVPAWQKAVDIMTETLDPPQKEESEQPEIAHRFLWVLSQSDRWIRILPMEQKVLKSGRWGSPVEIGLQRIQNTEKYFSGADPADLNRLSLFRKHSSFIIGLRWEEMIPLLRSLVASPHVYWNAPSDRPMEVTTTHPEIHVTQKGESYSVLLHPERIKGALPGIAKWDPPRKIVLLETTKEEDLIASLLPEKLTIPANQPDAVAKLVRSLSRRITVHSDLSVDGTHRDEIPPDSRMRILVLPVSGGYLVSLRVRPLGDSTQAYVPGSGLMTLYDTVDEHPVVVRRLPNTERESVRDLLPKLPSLGEEPPDDLEWAFEGPLELLDLLEEVRSLVERPLVEWPEGSSLSVRSPRTKNFPLIPVTAEEGFWLEGEMSIEDGDPVSLSRLLDGYKNRKGRFLPLGDGEFLVLTQSLLKFVGEVSAYTRSEKDRVSIDPLSAGLFAEHFPDIDTSGNKQWKVAIDRFRLSQDFEPILPQTLEASLRPYQEEGFRWLSRLASWGAGACLADDMGLGKTVQILALLLSRADKGPSLVVAPASVVGNWIRETARFAPTLRVSSLYDGDREGVLKNAGPFHLILSSYTLLSQEIDRLAEISWEAAVLDEAQAIKNFDTRRAQAAFRLNADVRIAASGTPVENHLQELWSIFRFLNPGYLGSRNDFQEQYVLPVEQNRDASVRLRLRKKIQPFLLRRTKTQVLDDLPPKTEITLSVDLGPEERALYETIRQEAIDRVEESTIPGAKSMILLASLMRLRRAACHPSLILPGSDVSSSKTAAFMELVEELRENSHRALVFSAFVDHLNLLKGSLGQAGVSFLSLDGSTPQSERSSLVERFQSGEGDLFLISLKAGGTGLNLTGADYVIHMDPWWNPAAEDQATDRAHRIGQERPVTVYRLVAAKTIEEKILALHRTKRELADSLLEGSDTAVTLNVETMMDLLKL